MALAFMEGELRRRGLPGFASDKIWYGTGANNVYNKARKEIEWNNLARQVMEVQKLVEEEIGVESDP